MYRIAYAQSARRALKRLRRSGSFKEAVFKELLVLFMYNRSLPIHFQDHALHGSFMEYRECHLGFNLLLLYERDEVLKIITIANIGTHPELFGE
ncbi:MAG: type II toxin-antitoxin system mRNA interferase toxin, RelE/StbE family [Candidatus Paceibacterota bacterium]|jgi:mRNA interferase YafQ